jgi:predicted ATPase
MLRSLTLKNFRAFRDQHFDFARINIFVGANSSGKSSAVSAINFIAQSILQRDLSSGPLAFNGPFEQLGTFIDVVHGNRANTPLRLDFTYGRSRTVTHRIGIELKYRKIRRQIEISNFEYHHDNAPVYEYRVKKDAYELFWGGRKFEALVPSLQKRRPDFRLLFPLDHNLMRYASVVSTPTDKDLKKSSQEKMRFVERQMRRARMDLRQTLEEFDSLSPFRDQPQRTYLFTGEAPSRVGRTGTYGVSMLVNDASQRGRKRDVLIDKISEWLREAGIGRGLVLRPLTDRHFEICIRDLDGKQHNICDVGFGCSQVLPVLIGALNTFGNVETPYSSAPIFVVQEPEIHLHPNAQAAIGSFFVSLVQKRGQIFIETHSDNLVLRVARHVAAGQIDPADVAIFFFSNEEDGKHVERLNFDDRASFKPTWPGGFFPQREREALGLAKARSKRSNAVGNDRRQLKFTYPKD